MRIFHETNGSVAYLIKGLAKDAPHSRLIVDASNDFTYHQGL